PGGDEGVIAVNAEAGEVDLRRIDGAALAALVEGGAVLGESVEAVHAAAAARAGGIALGEPLLAAVIVLLVLETALANRRTPRGRPAGRV
ncbi:MAG: hypothetical protein GX591_00615, partial [Planctomycetes bacterium]|nr:hypothetical protein [Planctomycetota bacterium]